MAVTGGAQGSVGQRSEGIWLPSGLLPVGPSSGIEELYGQGPRSPMSPPTSCCVPPSAREGDWDEGVPQLDLGPQVTSSGRGESGWGALLRAIGGAGEGGSLIQSPGL